MSDTKDVGDVDPDQAELERVAAEAGKAGNIRAIEVWLRLREARDPAMTLDLPPIDDLDGVDKAQAAVLAAAARVPRRLTPRDALYLSATLENRRRALTVRDLERRLIAAEQANIEREKERER